ncbi:MAG: hypothetical protein J5806_10455 [Lentisphaeria bacterium]|nr:hypothetical protein [Lentisphaeria bacterium]
MRRYAVILTLTVMMFAFFYPQPEARAMDPVTIAILAPIAIQVAKAMMPYVIRGMINMGRMGMKAGREMLNILRLPLGLVQVIFLWPWGRNFSSGLRNLGHGAVAPFMMTFYFLLLPFSAFGVGV